MKLIRLHRQFSVNTILINEDAIDSSYTKLDKDTNRVTAYILVRSGIEYDINEKSFKLIQKLIGASVE